MIKVVNLTLHVLYLHTYITYIYFHILRKRVRNGHTKKTKQNKTGKSQAVPGSLQKGCFFLSHVNLTTGNWIPRWDRIGPRELILPRAGHIWHSLRKTVFSIAGCVRMRSGNFFYQCLPSWESVLESLHKYFGISTYRGSSRKEYHN